MTTSQTPKLDELSKRIREIVIEIVDNNTTLKQVLYRVAPDRPVEALLLSVLLIIFLMMVGLLGHTSVLLISVAYPIHRSLMAAKEDEPDDRFRWLTFWLLFGFLARMDPLLQFILGFLPSFYVFKLALLISLQHPDIDLALAFFTKFIKPHVVRVEPIPRD